MEDHSTKQIVLAFFGNLMVAVLKFIVAGVSGSAVMFSEGLHSVADTANQLFLLFGIKRAERPADEEHQFGFGKERFFWSLIAAFGILIIGSVLSIQRGAHAITHPEEISHIQWPLLVIVLSILIEGYTLLVTYKFLRKTKGKASLFRYIDDSSETAVITVFFEDMAAVLGLLIAGVGVTLSYILHTSLYDGIASVVIGILLGFVAIFLVNKNKELLTDQSHLVINKKVEAIFVSHPAVEKYHDLRTIIFGPHHVVVVSDVEFKEEFVYEDMDQNLKESQKQYTEHVIKKIGLLTDQLEHQIRTVCPEVKEIYLEVEQDHTIASKKDKLSEPQKIS
ncbi:MAG: cation diffusion facilitator family transporter [bacterium]|nr:cation diffusion facilitator family transporter [bacterium]